MEVLEHAFWGAVAVTGIIGLLCILIITTINTVECQKRK